MPERRMIAPGDLWAAPGWAEYRLLVRLDEGSRACVIEGVRAALCAGFRGAEPPNPVVTGGVSGGGAEEGGEGGTGLPVLVLRCRGGFGVPPGLGRLGRKALGTAAGGIGGEVSLDSEESCLDLLAGELEDNGLVVLVEEKAVDDVCLCVKDVEGRGPEGTELAVE